MGKFVTSKIKGEDNITINFSDAFKEIESDLKGSIRDAASDFFRECVNGTPVDTGFARSRWSADLLSDVREAPTKVVTSKDDGVTYGSAEDTIQKHLPRINRLGNKNLNGLNVTNDAPYIGRLEEGWSSQNQYWVRAAAKRLAGKIGSIVKR